MSLAGKEPRGTLALKAPLLGFGWLVLAQVWNRGGGPSEGQQGPQVALEGGGHFVVRCHAAPDELDILKDISAKVGQAVHVRSHLTNPGTFDLFLALLTRSTCCSTRVPPVALSPTTTTTPCSRATGMPWRPWRLCWWQRVPPRARGS